MRQFIFVTLEGYTYQPNSESTEPDIENLQVIGFGQGRDAQEGLTNMLEENPYLPRTSFNEVIALELANDKRAYFYLEDLR
jgi:hypothetical protein